jgi:1,4-dihydroxy-2-naphthoate octaprenyltransferase
MTDAALRPRTTLGGLLGVARAPFLPLAVLLAASGSLAQARGAPDPTALLVAAVGLVAAHVLVNVLNELADDASGLDRETERTPFSGGSGALQRGLVTRPAARALAWAAGAVTAAAGAWAILLRGHVDLLPIVAGGAACILLYSPWLLRAGVGEIAAGVGLGGLPVLGAATLQGGAFTTASLAVAAFATCATFNLLLLNTIPDREPDRRAGRRPLVHRIGVRGVAVVALASWALATAILTWATAAGALPPWCWLWAAPALLFLAPFLPWLRAGAPTPIPVPVLGANVVHNLGTHLALAIGLVLGG